MSGETERVLAAVKEMAEGELLTMAAQISKVLGGQMQAEALRVARGMATMQGWGGLLQGSLNTLAEEWRAGTLRLDEGAERPEGLLVGDVAALRARLIAEEWRS